MLPTIILRWYLFIYFVVSYIQTYYMDDFLSSFLAGEWAETGVNKIYKLMNIIAVFTFVWIAISLLNLYKFIENAPVVSRLPHAFYEYKILPAVAVVSLAMNAAWIVLQQKAFANWKKCIQTSDDNLLQKGLKDFYSATILLAVWFIVSIANDFYRTFLM